MYISHRLLRKISQHDMITCARVMQTHSIFLWNASCPCACGQTRAHLMVYILSMPCFIQLVSKTIKLFVTVMWWSYSSILFEATCDGLLLKEKFYSAIRSVRRKFRCANSPSSKRVALSQLLRGVMNISPISFLLASQLIFKGNVWFLWGEIKSNYYDPNVDVRDTLHNFTSSLSVCSR